MKSVMVVFMLFFGQSIYAKRMAPDKVKPVVHNGIEYKAMGMSGMGTVQATDTKTKKVLWVKAIYKIEYNKNLEGDVQDVFIKVMSLSKDRKFLIVINEDGGKYQLNLKSKDVLHIINDKMKRRK